MPNLSPYFLCIELMFLFLLVDAFFRLVDFQLLALPFLNRFFAFMQG
jgi:hypothetical protein